MAAEWMRPVDTQACVDVAETQLRVHACVESADY